MDNYNKELENNLLEKVKQKQEADKRLLRIEFLVGILCLAVLVALTVVVSLVDMEEWLKETLVIIGAVPIFIAAPFMIKIDQTAGYYKCAKCGHRYVPKYLSVFAAMHMGTTRYMECPKCHKKSWQKKVLEKE